MTTTSRSGRPTTRPTRPTTRQATRPIARLTSLLPARADLAEMLRHPAGT